MDKYKEFNKKVGVYIIRNTINNKIYIGSAVNILNRIKDHIKRLKSKTHKNKLLQNHFNKYGMCFYFEVLEFCNKEDLIEVEQFMLDKHLSYIRKNGFNINKIANSMLGFKHSEKTKSNWSAKRKGIRFSSESKKNMSESKKGSKHPKAKLTEEQVIEIRTNNNNKRDYSLKTSIKYNVSWHTINYILKRKTWTHI
jgi:group I intron endonuclease